ncbi:MAG: hypothetical protein ACR2OU_10670 [Thermomicrobiales bacterium]
MKSSLRAGVYCADATPPIGIAHSGWGAQSHERAVGVDLPLTVTALALSDDSTTSLIIDIDICFLVQEDAARARKAVSELTGVPETNIRLSYTHTHSDTIRSLAGTWFSSGTEMVEPYIANLQSIIVGTAQRALDSQVPARIAGATGASSISVNRRFARPEDGVVVVGRNWDGIVDPEVQVLRIDTVEGLPLAAIVNFACHPITVGPDNDLLTPDYPGVLKRTVKDSTGATTLFLQGAAGDIGPIRGVARDGINQYRRLGAMLGLEASKLWWSAETVPMSEEYAGTLESGAPLALYDERPLPERDTTLRVAFRTVDLPVKTMGDPELLVAAAQGHAAEIERLRVAGSPAEDIKRETMQAKRASMRANLAQRLSGVSTWPVEMYATTIGDDIALLAMATEPFTTIGLAIKERSPFAQTLVSGYSGVGWAYLPTADAYPLGGYEIEVTPFAPEAAEIAIEQALDLLNELKGLSS